MSTEQQQGPRGRQQRRRRYWRAFGSGRCRSHGVVRRSASVSGQARACACVREGAGRGACVPGRWQLVCDVRVCVCVRVACDLLWSRLGKPGLGAEVSLPLLAEVLVGIGCLLQEAVAKEAYQAPDSRR